MQPKSISKINRSIIVESSYQLNPASPNCYKKTSKSAQSPHATLPNYKKKSKTDSTASNSEEFSREYQSRFKFTPPPELPNAQTVITVAMPRPLTKAAFTWNGKTQSYTLPPIYTAHDKTKLYVEHTLAEELETRNYKTATAMLPLKLLAARSGLAEYGKNNIAYVSGMGSFMRLTALYSDMPCTNDARQQAQAMKRCETCNLCSKACPTGAISQSRFLLRAEKCLTYHNEKAGNIPFPDWIKPEWHNCPVGCIRCQATCPENKPFMQQVGEAVSFTETETKLLMKGVPTEQIPRVTLKKLQLLRITDHVGEFPRNLSAFLK